MAEFGRKIESKNVKTGKRVVVVPGGGDEHQTEVEILVEELIAKRRAGWGEEGGSSR